MHSRKFRNGTKKWRKQHRKFRPNTLMWWKTVDPNPGYLITAEELKSVMVIDMDDGTKGRHTFHEFDDAELLVPEGAIKYEQDELCL